MAYKVKVELGVARYEGNLKTWYTVSIPVELPTPVTVSKIEAAALAEFYENLPEFPIAHVWVHHIYNEE